MRFRLRGPEPVLLEIRQVVSVRPVAHPEGIVALFASSGYRFLVDRDGRPQEIMAFHWTPDAPPPQRRLPHLHVGSLVASASPFRGADFHKLHVPTGVLTLEAVLLFAVEELGVETAQRRDRAAVIDLLRERDRVARRIDMSDEEVP